MSTKFTKEQKASAELTIRSALNKEKPTIWFQQHSRTRSQLPKPIIQFFYIKHDDIYQLTRPIWIYLDRRLNKNEDGILCSFGCDGYDIIQEVSAKLFRDIYKINAVRI